MNAVTVQDIKEAQARIRGVIRETPIMPSSAFDGWLKLENLQLTGAYKVRGALNALIKQVQEKDTRPVIVASAGNHSAGIAFAAHKLGLQSVAVVPVYTPRVKIERAESLGTEVIRHGEDFEGAFAEAKHLSESRGWHFIHPFDDPDVIAGQGTIGLELLHMKPDVVALPIGGGGLASGVGTVLKAHGVRVVGVQVQGVDAMARKLAGRKTPFFPRATVADGIRVRSVGARTAAICDAVLDAIMIVSESEVTRAMKRLAFTDHVIAEGAGAVAVAALDRLRGERKVAVVSGGNVDPATLSSVMRTRKRPTGPRGKYFI